ncbi:tricarboxylate transporter [Telmatospirillum sp. J64-1]|uniref:tricarboxylate transporter n=1 Tax=Telmatospirillum sp. J64-1 TaxID=2502183 RepID=UPI00115DFA5E|nr:tricarboxylate transporter [Telmatospirillum sp. J64-1]
MRGNMAQISRLPHYAGLTLLLLAFTPGAVHAASAEDDWKVEWVVPFQPGGGTDIWARYLAARLQDELRDTASIHIRNIPGGGSTKGANYFHGRAQSDGSMLFSATASTQIAHLLGDRRVQYDYSDWQVLAASGSGGVVYVSSETGILGPEEIAKLKGRSLKFGSIGAATLDMVPLLAFEMLGLDVKVVFGMSSRGAARLGLERGEFEIDYQTSSAYLTEVLPLIKAGKAVPLMSWGVLDKTGKVVRDPSFPELPTFVEVYEQVHGQPPSGAMWEAWSAAFKIGYSAHKMLFMPKGTSEEVAEIYKAALSRIAMDEAFQEKSRDATGAYSLVVGKEAEALLKLGTTMDRPIREWFLSWLKKRFEVTP